MKVKEPLNTFDSIYNMHRAIINNDIHTLKSLITTNPTRVNSKDELGFTPLHIACALGHVQATKILLARKADPNIRDNKHRNALHAAIFSKNEEIVDLLLKFNSEVTVSSKVKTHDNLARLQNETLENNIDHKRPSARENNDPRNNPNIGKRKSKIKDEYSDSESDQESDDESSQPMSTLLSILSHGNDVVDDISEQSDVVHTNTANNMAADTTLFDSLDQSASLLPARHHKPVDHVITDTCQLEREYLSYMRQKNLELIHKKVRQCQMLNDRLNVLIQENKTNDTLLKRKDPSNDESKRKPEDDGKHIENDEEISSTNQNDTIENLNINLSKLRERNIKLEHLAHTKLNDSSITQEDIIQYETINQKLFINALSKLLQENFTLKKELNHLKGTDFDTTIETGKEFLSCEDELKKHYDVTDDRSDKSSGFFQRFMKKKKNSKTK